jgi:hypothetical protein
MNKDEELLEALDKVDDEEVKNIVMAYITNQQEIIKYLADEIKRISNEKTKELFKSD